MIDHLRHNGDQVWSCSQFVTVMEKTIRCLDQMLGYKGQDRFVIYYYEPRGEEVLWRDSRSYGFATGAWLTFLDEVAPVADHYKMDVGCGGMPGRHVLLIDRLARKAYFAERSEAMQFLSQVEGGSSEIQRQVPAAMIEITHAAVANLAHEIWERKGRPQGHELQDWLEAEEVLRHNRPPLAKVQ